MKYNQGFTLIELLVSMSLLSMVIFVGASAFGLYGQRWNDQLGTFESTLKRSRDVMLVQEVLDSLVPYMAYDYKDSPAIYFEGNRNGFVAVSGKSIYSDGNFAVIRLSATQNQDLTFDVKYEEWPMENDVLRSTTQPIAFYPPISLFESVTNPLFEYYGWENIREKEIEDDILPAPPPRWLPNYNGLDAMASPLKVKFSFDSLDGPFTILAVLAGPKPALISRYMGGRAKHNSTLDTIGEDDDCKC